MQIKVKKEDIVAGRIGNPLYCPIALAVQRAFPKKGVMVSYRRIALIDRKLTEYPLPEGLREWIVRYDKGLPVPLVSFKLAD